MPELSNERKTLLEMELAELHQEERNSRNYVVRNINSRKQPVLSEGFDKQELYDKYGHC